MDSITDQFIIVIFAVNLSRFHLLPKWETDRNFLVFMHLSFLYPTKEYLNFETISIFFLWNKFKNLIDMELIDSFIFVNVI